MKQHHNFQEFLRYSLLNMLGMIGLSCYILADTFFVSKGLGTKGLAALNLAIPVYNLIHGSGLMLGMGGSVKFSVFQSQKKEKDARRVFTNTLYMVLFFAVFFSAAGLFFSHHISRLLGADANVFSMTNTYLKVLLLFAPAFLLNDTILCFVRNDGNPKLSMTAMIVGSLSNIILDYIFIFPCGMGMFGAVFATGLAPVISLLILSGHFRKKENHLKVSFAPISSRLCLTGITLGLPSFITEVSSGIVMIVFNYIILGLEGNVGVAAYGVIANISLVVIAIFTSLGQGIQPLVSRSLGQRAYKDMKAFLSYAVCSSFLIAAAVYFFTFQFAEALTAIFNSEHNPMLQAIASDGIKLYFIGMFFAGCNIVLSLYFSASEHAIPAQLISTLRGFIILIPVSFLLSGIWQMTGVWLAFPVTELITFLVGIIAYFRIPRYIS